MIRKTLPALLVLVFGLSGCKSLDHRADRPSTRPASRPAPPPEEAAWRSEEHGPYQGFGAEFNPNPEIVVPASTLVAHLDEFLGKKVVVTGEVTGTCKRKGCWMNVNDGRGSMNIFVRFKDYGFFVPRKGAEGRRVVFEGQVQKKTLSVEEARHYLEDAGDFEAAAKVTEPREIPFVMAHGVRMYR